MERKRDASRKLAETTQKHFLPVNSAPGDKAGIPAPPEHPPLVDPVVRAAWGCCSLGDVPPGEAKGWGRLSWRSWSHLQRHQKVWLVRSQLV